jgi:hypothetical protein
MEPRRPPSLLPSCGVLPCLSSFLYFERDSRGPSKSPCSDIAALRDRLPAGGRVAHRIISRYIWDTTLMAFMFVWFILTAGIGKSGVLRMRILTHEMHPDQVLVSLSTP